MVEAPMRFMRLTILEHACHWPLQWHRVVWHASIPTSVPVHSRLHPVVSLCGIDSRMGEHVKHILIRNSAL
jgi:hypothetical protein